MEVVHTLSQYLVASDDSEVMDFIDVIERERAPSPPLTIDIEDDPEDIAGEGCLTCLTNLPRIEYSCGHVAVCGTCDLKILRVAASTGNTARCILCRASRE